jgi:thiol-disulfide isomerase/thioredoxin
MNTMKNIALLALLAASLGACGSTIEPDPGAEVPRDVYPSGPYGTKVGTIIEKLSFQAVDGSTYGLGEVFADPQNRVLLLSSVAGWCGPCVQEQEKLSALHHTKGDKGLVVMAAMSEDTEYRPATIEDVLKWQTEHDLPNTVRDAPNSMKKFSPDGTLPLNMLIDVDTMEILYVGAGFNEAEIGAIIRANLPQ